MTTHIQLIQFEGLEGILYAFDKRGEGLMAHTHEADTAHDILVMKGAVKVLGDLPTAILVEGDHHTFDWRVSHEVLALEDNTIIFNRFLNGIPVPFRDLPMDRRVGSVEDTLHNPIPYYSVLR
jgi:hypothetical protein